MAAKKGKITFKILQSPKFPQSGLASAARKLEEVSIVISVLESYLKERKLYPKLQREMKQLGNKYLELWKQHKRPLTDKERAFAEAEMLVDLIIYAKDMAIVNNDCELVQKYLPRSFVKNLRKLSRQALEVRRTFPFPKTQKNNL